MRVGINTEDYADSTNAAVIGITAEKVRLVLKAISNFFSVVVKNCQKKLRRGGSRNLSRFLVCRITISLRILLGVSSSAAGGLYR